MYLSRKIFIAAELGIGSTGDSRIPKLRATLRPLTLIARHIPRDDAAESYWRRHFDSDEGTGEALLA